MPFTIATWNINSVRLRLPIVERLLAGQAPDILCLQETKCPDELFPLEAFERLGYPHIAISGQKGYHGVATIAKRPITIVERRQFCGIPDARHLATRFQAGGVDVLLHNFYVPAGGDEPDPEINPKFRHKLGFVEEMRAVRAEASETTASILVGDLNIAPLETDVWNHKALLKIVSHTPIEVDHLQRVFSAGPWVDAIRHLVPEPERLYTWWSYRSPQWQLANKGRRLDHVWLSQKLSPQLQTMEILKDARGWDRPSDHVPVIVDLDA